ncbi:MAG: GNAT family N-acetyltransferase [Candidatus Eremiobacteraeota bacterium]|nr:GNAT family N-acetyltransferase [Candidatus Eremiobacteraeota bacterium]
MEVRRITTLDAFDAERPRWEALEKLDPHLSVFLTWKWLRAYLPTSRLRWSVLVARDGDAAVAYLPIARNSSLLDRELFLGGNPAADYTGMIASPDRAEAAIGVFADALLAEPWDAFNVCDVADPHIDTLVRRLVARGALVASTAETKCLSCALPATWEAYITNCITAKTRVNTVRVERKLAEALPEFRVSEPCDADIDAHVDAMIVVNHKRWGGNLRNARARYGAMFRNAYDQGILRMVIYWDGTRPIAGATAFTDTTRAWFGLYMIGFDEAYEKLSPGKGIVGRAIRLAIEAGFTRFDFMRGPEAYKARYASDVFVTRHYRMIRGGLRAAAIEFARPKLLVLKLALASLVYGAKRQP